MTDDPDETPDIDDGGAASKKKPARKAAKKPAAEPEAPAAEPVKYQEGAVFAALPTPRKAPTPRKKKATAEKATAEKATAEKATAKKATAKKATAKKATAKKATAKAKAPAKKPARGKRARTPVDDVDLSDDAPGDETMHGKALVVVESPAKAKTINKYLGKDYVVKASYGHVRDLPGSDLGIEIEKGFEPEYHVLEGKKKVVAELKRTAKNASRVFLACDMDREGEAIAWHVSEILKNKKDVTQRVTFNEITKAAIEKAFQHPRALDMNKVNAQQARRVLDRIVGYKLSPLLWKKVARNLSAGRVQSVAVKLVVEREREVRAFVATEYWDLEARLAKADAPPAPPPPPPAPEGEKVGELATRVEKAEVPPLGPGRFFAKLVQVGEEKLDPAKFRLKDAAEAAALKAEVESSPFVVASIKKAERRDNPKPPFITSTLQQDASSRLRFATSRTMRIAQQLYEGVEVGEEGSVGLITYMRTDSFNLAAEAVEEARGFIRTTYGPSYLPDEARAYKRDSKAGAQEAHEAIRPTSALRTPEALAKHLTDDQLKVYTLIWERFIACQMPAAVYSQTTVDVKAARAIFRANGRTLIFDGHQRVGSSGKKDNEPILPDLSENETLALEKLQESQHFTQPPARYNEGTLVKMLEQLGIGRPSTYSTIISTIQERGYVKQDSRRLFATKLGEIVTDKLSSHFHDIMDTGFTAEMESRLDRVEEGAVEWQKILQDFYGPFEKELETAKTDMKGLNEDPQQSDVKCPKCGRLMVYKWNKTEFSRFLGCPGYDTEDKCKETMPVDEAGEPQVPEETDEQCPECGSSMVIRTGRRGRFLACSAYPNCKVTREVAEDGKAELLPDLEADCELCGKKMVVRRGRRGPFLGCTGYPECRGTRPIVTDESGKAKAGERSSAGPEMPQIDVKCEKCGSAMKVRFSKRGPFLGCTAYPKCKGTAQVPGDVKIPERAPPQELGENCEACGKPLVKRFGRRGPFAACSGYPKCKNTKPLSTGA